MPGRERAGMCNRFSGDFWEPELRIRFRAAGHDFDVLVEDNRKPDYEIRPDYNVAPTNTVAVVTTHPEGRKLDRMRWGVVPAWTPKDGKALLLTNARDDKLLSSPVWRGPFKAQRCIVPATGYHEWDKQKQPWHFRIRDGEPFGFAALWCPLPEPVNGVTASVAIITTEPNELAARVHNRMPAILRPEDEEAWLEGGLTPQQAHALLRPYPEAEMVVFPVARAAFNKGADRKGCVTPVRL